MTVFKTYKTKEEAIKDIIDMDYKGYKAVVKGTTVLDSVIQKIEVEYYKEDEK